MAVKSKNILSEVEAKWGYIKGTSKWAKVLEVGQFGDYSVDLYGDLEAIKEEAEALQLEAEEIVKEAGKKYQLADLTKENDDGEEYIQFKMKPTKFDGTEQMPTIYNDHGDKVEDWDKLIGNGSTIKVKYMIKPYYMNSTKMIGVSYKFYAVQVIKLSEYSGKGESGFGDESANFGSDESPVGEDF